MNNIETALPLLGMLLVVAVLAAPAITSIVNNLREARRIRRLKSATPGPLLGVVFPPHKDTDKETD